MGQSWLIVEKKPESKYARDILPSDKHVIILGIALPRSVYLSLRLEYFCDCGFWIVFSEILT